MLRTVLLSSLLLPLLLPYGALAYHDILKRDAKDHHWDYEKEGTGPENWPKMFKECGGDTQSPIDIDNDDVDLNDKLNEFIYSDNYDDPIEGATIKNNGHTIQISPGPKDVGRWIDEGGLDDEYHFEQIHFHWGSDSKKGSEHTIDGKAFPLEMHLVHRNKDYKTMQAALKKSDGLAVLGVLFKVDDEDNPAFEPIIDKLDDVRKEGSRSELDDSFNLLSLLPDDMMPYYRYQGSLTTPPCSEVVTWTVFKNFVPISEKQLQQFRNVKEEEEGEPEETLVDNFRPIQPLGSRVVQVSPEESNDSTVVTPTLFLLLSLLAALLLLKNY